MDIIEEAVGRTDVMVSYKIVIKIVFIDCVYSI